MKVLLAVDESPVLAEMPRLSRQEEDAIGPHAPFFFYLSTLID